MKQSITICALVLLGFSTVAWASPHKNSLEIQQVASGQLTTANAAWWGFNKNDSTKALQAAINSGAKTVKVPYMGSPWIVNTTIHLASNQTIVFEKGVVIQAKKGAFHKKYAFLFFANNKKNITLKGYGATFKMRKADYDSSAYTKSEWRHALCLQGCKNVKILGLRIESSGGDGIYIGKSGAYPGTRKASQPPYYCKNIVIKDVVLDDNYRQGISVITVDGLLMENVVMSNTSGTAPMAGIDFEPNNAGGRLSNIVLRNCITKNNRGGGVDLALWKLDETSPDISIKFEHCQFINDDVAGVRLITSNNPAQIAGGKVEFTNCKFQDSKGPAVIIQNKSAKGDFNVQFKNCQIVDAAIKHPSMNPIEFLATGGKRKATWSVGGVVFQNCYISDSLQRYPIGYVAHTSAPLSDITGTLIVKNRSKTKRYILSEKLLKKWIPARDFDSVPFISLNKIHIQAPTQNTKHLIQFRPVNIRGLYGAVKFALYARKGQQVKLTLKYGQAGSYSGSKIPIKVKGPLGKIIATYPALFKKETTIQFTPPVNGLYIIEGKPGNNYLSLISATQNVNLVITTSRLDLFQSGGSYYFCVPKGTKKFAIQGEGQSQAEGFRMILKNPQGKTIRDIDNLVSLSQVTIKPALGNTGAIWHLQIKRASHLRFEDITIKLLGVPPLLALTPEGVIQTAN